MQIWIRSELRMYVKADPDLGFSYCDDQKFVKLEVEICFQIVIQLFIPRSP
jgi:hypothetical protein